MRDRPRSRRDRRSPLPRSREATVDATKVVHRHRGRCCRTPRRQPWRTALRSGRSDRTIAPRAGARTTTTNTGIREPGDLLDAFDTHGGRHRASSLQMPYLSPTAAVSHAEGTGTGRGTISWMRRFVRVGERPPSRAGFHFHVEAGLQAGLADPGPT